MMAVPLERIMSITWADPLSYVAQACLGRVRSWNGRALTYLEAGQPYCDWFMQTIHCASAAQLQNNEACSCFADAQQLAVAYPSIHLPVNCFGTRCAFQAGYKTQSMQRELCNLTVCQSTLQKQDQLFIAENSTVYCGGRYFEEVVTEDAQSTVQPVASLVTTPSVIYVPLSTVALPWYTTVLFICSGLVFLLLMYLLFAKRPVSKTTQSVPKLGSVPGSGLGGTASGLSGTSSTGGPGGGSSALLSPG
jgi:hypothetical protein